MNVSIAVCTYNGGRFLKDQLKSIVNQTVAPNEIVICDDGSSDDTWLILQQFKDACPDINIQLTRNASTLKTIKNFEKAIRSCSGNFIFLCDQDDIWEPDKIERMVYFAKKTKALFLFTNGNLIDENNHLLNRDLWGSLNFTSDKQRSWARNINAVIDLLNFRNYATGATGMVKRELLGSALPLNAPFGFYHDAWFALHAAAKNRLRFMDEKLIRYRIHAAQQVGITPHGKNADAAFSQPYLTYETFLKQILRQYPLSGARYLFSALLTKIKARL